MQEGLLLMKIQVAAVILIEKEIEAGTRTLDGVTQNETIEGQYTRHTQLFDQQLTDVVV